MSSGASSYFAIKYNVFKKSIKSYHITIISGKCIVTTFITISFLNHIAQHCF